MSPDDQHRVVVVGAGGDLVLRHLLPAIRQLTQRREIGAPTLLCLDRADLDVDGFRRRARAHLGDAPGTQLLLERLSYEVADVTRESDLRTTGADLVVLALPPAVLPTAARLLAAAPPVRLLVEKPYGATSAAADELDDRLLPLLGDDLLRADHLVHHAAVRDLAAWGAEIEGWVASASGVEVRWDETAPLGPRARFFDEVGATRDMVQSHLLQLLATVLAASARPHDDAPGRRADALAASHLDPAARLVRARYAAGPAGGAYVAEPGVDPDRCTETFVSVPLRAHDGALAVRLTTGKALGSSRREVVLTGRDGRRTTLDLAGPRLVVDVDGRRLAPRHRLAEDDSGTEPLTASASQLRDALRGRRSRFVSTHECRQQWRVTDAVLTALPDTPLTTYRAGGDAPTWA